MNKPGSLTRVAFETEPSAVAAAQQAGVRDFMVDWECRGKEARQSGYDTEINRKTLEDLSRVVSHAGAVTWCRINGPGFMVREEVDRAVEAGASIVLLPMVKTPSDVESFLECVAGRCRAGILMETPEAFREVAEIARFPLDAVYVGLNDLMIGLGNGTIFHALADGLVDEVRFQFDVPLFGFGGLTVLDGGYPLPCRMFLQEMSRLKCNMTFLRRSYRRDIVGRDARAEAENCRLYWEALSRRSPEEVHRDHQEFLRVARAIEQGSPT